MKVKDGYLLRTVAGSPVVVPVGNTDFNGMITLNEVGGFLWEKMETETTEEALLQAILDAFEVEEETAKADLKAFLASLRDADLLA